MKTGLLLAACWLLCFRMAHAQEPAVLIIYMADTGVIEVRDTSDGVLELYSANNAIQNILNDYEVYGFEKAYAVSRFPYMHHYYLVVADSSGLLYQLLAYDQELFPHGHEEKYELTYTPNDYGAYGPFPLPPPGTILQPGHSGQPELDYIGAKAAWDITQGSPDVVIGITDSYFDLDHPEFSGKIAQVRHNVLLGGETGHGTMTAGLIAAATNNNTGIAAIGFNCRLDVSNPLSRDKEMLKISNSGRRILNGSWFLPLANDCSAPMDRVDSICFNLQGVYNEIYENGTIPFFGAGNYDDQACGLSGYAYPASLDHCMSITSVGCEFPVGTISMDSVGSATHTPLWGGYNWKGVHKINADLPESDPRSSFHHNDKVDLAAPGYYIKTLAFNPSDPGWEYNWVPLKFSSGTSFSSPITAGTAGLMLSVNGCLSPYQIEYILKTTANSSIYSIPENAPYIGLLGAGALRADLAVAAAAAPGACNNPTTRTFFIKGVELNTVCAPGFASNGVLPKLTPIMEHGTAPYTYKWEPLLDNTTTLDASNIAQPTITASTGTRIASYRLTIYDSSPIQKVANKLIRIPLKTAGYDLAMRDLYMDMLDEPNSMAFHDPRNWNIWKSPDIWNRWDNDDERVHQQPEYFASDPNYLYVKVRNVGCAPAPAGKRLKLYWSIASTTEHWPGDWNGSATFPGSSLPLGGMTTPATGVLTPALAPGAATILHDDWYPPKPSDYYPGASKIETCLLARLEESSSVGMTFIELTNTPVGVNVINNNNIVTHNTFTTNLIPGNINHDDFHVLVGHARAYTHSKYTLQLVNDKHIHKQESGDISAVITTKVYLGTDLYARWAAGGYQGTYAAKNNTTKTVTFDGMNMELKNIELKNGEHFPVRIDFDLISGATVDDYRYTLHFREINESPGTRNPITGNVSYEIFTEKGASQPMMHKADTATGQNYNVYPNPTRDKVHIEYMGRGKKALIEILDIMGRSISSQQATLGYSPTSVSMNHLPSGIYLIVIKDQSGYTEQFKITKE